MGFVWSLPTTALGLCLLALGGFWKKAQFGYYRYKGIWILFQLRSTWCFPKGFVAVNLGAIMLYSNKDLGSKKNVDQIESHEFEHRRQCFILGPFMLVCYPVASLLAGVLYREPYTMNWFEIMARKKAGQE